MKACANACINKEGCNFFIYATGDYTGCYWEKTTDKSCPEGWIEDYNFDFYKMDSKYFC